MPDRIQCTIREYPPRNSTGALGEAILDQFRLVELILPLNGSFSSGIVLYSNCLIRLSNNELIYMIRICK